jgi:hypothetical protein
MAEKFKFSVDDKNLESDVPVLTGAQIKALAGIDASFGLFIEIHGRGSDEQIADNQSVDLSKPGREKFYAVPPATYGNTKRDRQRS